MTIIKVSGVNDDDSLDGIAQKIGDIVKLLPHETESFRFLTRGEVVDFMRDNSDDMTLYLDVQGKDPAILRSPHWPVDQVVGRIANADVIRDISLNPAPDFIWRTDGRRIILNISRPTHKN